MNILLVYPDYPDGFWTFNHVLRKYTTYSCVSPPIGLLTVAAMLPKEWNLRLIDTNAKGKIRDKDIRWADYVFISAMHLQWDAVRCLVDRCKSFGVKTVAGGPLFTRDYQSFDDIDHLLLYEGEVCVPQFLEDIKNNTTKHIYDWVEFPDMRNSPVPRWDMINVNHYARLNLQYTRGCPFNCEFCGIGNLFGRKTRAKDA